jgi:hypothetical protein
MVPSNNARIHHRKLSRFITSTEERLAKFERNEWSSDTVVSQEVWLTKRNLIIGYCATEEEQRLIEKIEKWPTLGVQKALFKTSRGEEGSKLALTSHASGSFYMVIPGNIERYFVDEGMRISGATLTSTKVQSLYNHPKIWIIRIQKMRWRKRLVCAFDDRVNTAGMKTLQIIISQEDDESALKYLLAILSSKLINYCCINYLADDMNQTYLEQIPIRKIDFSKSADKTLNDKLVEFVDKMLSLTSKLHTTTSESEKATLQNAITVTDAEIDRLVYELYGLTEEEIRIVEGEK